MNRRIAAAGVIWTLAILLSRVVGLVRERVLGATLGATGTADVYAAAFRIPDLANYVLASGALSLTLLPILAVHIERGDDARSSRTFSTIANAVVGFALVVLTTVWMLCPLFVTWLAPGFDAEQTQLLIHLTRIVLPAQLFFAVSPLLQASLLSRDHHAVAALTPLLYTGCVIAGGLIGGSAEGFAWGVLVGAAIGPFGLQLAAALRAGLRWSPILHARDPDLRTFVVRFIPIVVGQSIVVWDDAIATRLASGMGVGQIAILNYAKTIMKVPMGVFGAAMGLAAFPTLTRLCIEGKPGEAYRTIVASTRQVLFLAFGSQVVLTVSGGEVATAIYTTARITPAQIDTLGVCVGLYALALGAWSAQAVLFRGFYARGITWLPTWLGTAVLLAALPVYSWFSAAWGAYGIAAASSVAIVVYTVLLEVVLRRQIGEGPGYAGFLARAVPAVVIAIAIGFALRQFAPPPSYTVLAAILRGGVFAGVSGGVFVALARAFGVSEAGALVSAVTRRVSRAR